VSALVLGEVDQAEHAGDHGAVEAGGGDFIEALVLLDTALEDRVQQRVLGQRVAVLLVLAQLGGGRTVDGGLRNDLAPGRAVAPAAEVEHEGLGHVLDHREAAGHVAVQGAVADRGLALVAGGEHEPAELVGQRHQDVAADAGLQVFLGDVRRAAGPLRGKLGHVGVVQPADGDLAELDAEVARDQFRVGARLAGRIFGGHGHAGDAVRAERVDREGGDERGVDAAGQPDHHVLKAILSDVVAQSGDQSGVHLGLGVERRLHARGEGGTGPQRDLHRVRARGGGLQGQIGDQQVVREHVRARRHDAVDTDDEAAAVEHQFVLAADQVAQRHRRADAHRELAEDVAAQVVFAAMIGRGGKVDHRADAEPVKLRGGGTVGMPAILANVHRQQGFAGPQQQRGIARFKHALLVEDPEVGQDLLDVRAHAPAAAQHHRGVARLAVCTRDRSADQHGQFRRQIRREPVERFGAILQKMPLQHQVLRRIPGHHQLGRHQHIRARLPRLCRRRAYQRGIPRKIPDDGVDLGHGEANCVH
jgi:hypothetical protein